MTPEADTLITSALMFVAAGVIALIVYLLIRFFFVQCPAQKKVEIGSKLNLSAALIGAAPAALFLLIAYSFLLHAWIGSGNWPRLNGDEPRTIAFRIHALFAPGSLLAVPLELALLVWATFGIAKRGGHPAFLWLAFSISLGVLWLIIAMDPGNVFAWYFD